MSKQVEAVTLLVTLAVVGTVVADVGPPGVDGKPQGGDARAYFYGALVCAAFGIVLEAVLKVFVILYFVRDAPKRGMSPIVWIIFAVVAELVALLVYLCVRKPKLSADANSTSSTPRE